MQNYMSEIPDLTIREDTVEDLVITQDKNQSIVSGLYLG